MSETSSTSETSSEIENKESSPAPSGKMQGRKLWIMIVAVIVAIALIGTAVFVLWKPGGLSVEIDPTPVQIAAGESVNLTVVVEWGGDALGEDEEVKYLWSVDPVDLGTFNVRARQDVTFRAGLEGGEGTITCIVTAKGTEEPAEADLTVDPPFLDVVSIAPSVKTVPPGTSYNFTATAVSSVALPIEGVTFTWAITGLADCTLNATTGTKVMFTAGPTKGSINLTATGSYGGDTKTGSAQITVGDPPPRNVDYLWYDMFNCSFGSWWQKRWDVYKTEQVLSWEYPYVFRWYGEVKENTWDYTNLRLKITGKNMTDLNMNERPEFLPFFSPTERGGTAVIDWYLQYLTTEEMARYPDATAAWDDGWVVSLNGTTTLDKQAAKSVLNLTENGYTNFNTWWLQNKADVVSKYASWLQYEAGVDRLDIYPAYDYVLTLLTFDMDAEKVGESIVIAYDCVSWGMEVLMTRWMWESFMGTEWYFEDMRFKATIGPELATLDVTTVVVYAAYAYVGTLSGHPAWSWEALMQDYVPSTALHPHSDYDAYSDKTYVTYAPGSLLYGQEMTFDYTPGAFNLSVNETLRLQWPDDKVEFKVHYRPGLAVNYSDYMVVNYSEPWDVDFPGQVVTDNASHTISFIGPLDLPTWSRTQTRWENLRSEWDRLGILPYGCPYVEFESLNAVIPEMTGFAIAAPASIPEDDITDLTVTAMDQLGQPFPSFEGEVNFTSTDAAAVLPANYTFTAGDSGVHTFPGVSFGTSGVVWLTVKNSTNASQRGDLNITVTEKRRAASIDVDIYHLPATSIAEDVTVEVYDQYDDLFLNYTGTVSFASNRSADVTLPSSDYTFVVGDQGEHTLPAAVTFNAVNWFRVYANDTANASLSGYVDVNVTATPETITSFTVTGVTALLLVGQTSDVTVTAYNQFGGPFMRYIGTVTFSSNGTTNAVLPADYTFLVSDEGQKTFAGGVSFAAAGWYNVVVTDTVVGTATGSQANIEVLERPLEETFRMYDFFENPWEQYWDWRYELYETDIIINREPHKNVMLYNPDKLGRQGIIQAPYRWNITANNVTTMNVHNPVFMPILGTPNVAGAEAELDVTFDYLTNKSYTEYWSPYWHVPALVMNQQRHDGWYLGTVITATMNRQAAEEWIGLPQSEANPVTWWTANSNEHKWIYYDAWEAWIGDQGNNVFDIFSGFEFPYALVYDEMNLTVLGDGRVQLEIGHVNWGWEVLTTRWFTYMGLCAHEPYMQNATMHTEYFSVWTDMQYDGVAVYNLKAVKAHDSATNEGAWAWEPLLVDYMPSAISGHPSTFDPWWHSNYTSNNSVDPMFGQGVAYDAGLSNMSLSASQTFIIQLPTGNDVLCFLGEQGEPNSITDAVAVPFGPGILTNYTKRMYNGSMSLGYYYTGGVDLSSMYNPATKTITMTGPLVFDNVRDANGTLLRGAPYIEFNVSVVAGGKSVPSPAETPLASASSEAAMSAQMLSLAVISVVVLMSLVMLGGVERRKR